MTNITEWTDPAEVDSFLASNGTGLILKHSTRCPISAAALKEFEVFAAASPGVRVHLVLVIENRPVSLAITAKLGIPHESPQAILLRDGAVVWSASHGSITREALAKACDGVVPKASQGAST